MNKIKKNASLQLTSSDKQKIELMAPAGSFASLQAAIASGADSVYFGVGKLNMRSRAGSFNEKDLKKIVNICHKSCVKAYLTLNTVLYDEDLIAMKNLCKKAKKYGVDCIIASDISAIEYAKSIGLPVHISTQANISNIEAVRFYSQYADTIVLARELKLEQIEKIVNQIRKEYIYGPSGQLVNIEIFCHGALCVSVSGKCYMSLAQFNHSANRGDCFQTCRRKYRVFDDETGNELVIDNQYVMSPKDLCTITFLDKIVQSGVKVLKIEGRGRSPEYVATVVKVYKEAIESITQKTWNSEKVAEWLTRLETVYNRGFWQGGYYLGKKLGEWSGAGENKATQKKEYLGRVLNYYARVNAASILIEATDYVKEKTISFLIEGPTTGSISVNSDVFLEKKRVTNATKGQIITIQISTKVRPNDKVYVVYKTNEEK